MASDAPKHSRDRQHGSLAVGHPVDVASGVFFSTFTEIELGGAPTLQFQRIYNTGLLSRRERWQPFGAGWTFNLNQRVHPTLEGLVHIDPVGQETLFDLGQIERAGDRATTAAGGVELQAIDEQTLRLVRFGQSRARDTWLFRRSGTGADYELAGIERGPGHHIEVSRDRFGRTALVKQRRSGRGVQLAYDGQGRLESLRLVHGEDSKGLLLSKYGYDDAGRLDEVSDERGVRERFEYDGAGRMTAEMRRNGAVHRMRYDRDGRCVHVVGSGGFQERRIKYLPTVQLTEVADSHGHVTSYQYNQSGQVTGLKLPLDEQVTYAYDALGRLTGQVLANGQTFAYEHDAAGHLIASSLPDGRRVEYQHDADHRLVAVTDGDKRTELGYDAGHNLASVKTPTGARWSFTHDEQGDWVATVDPNGVSTTATFDQRGDCVAESNGYGAVSRFVHDEWGQLVQETNPFGHSRQYQYDRFLRLVRCTDPEGHTWQFEHSPEGNRLVRHDATGRWEFRYNSCGKVTEIIDPEGRSTTYSWDTEPNRLLQVTNPLGDRYQFEYDALGRLSKRVAWDGTETRFEWKRAELAATIDALGRRTEYKHDGAGRLVERVGPDESLTYTYDDDGRIASLTENGVELALKYDADGHILSERQDGIELRRRYDAKGRLLWLGSDVEDNLLFEWDQTDRCAAVNRESGSVRFTRDMVGREAVRHLEGGARLSFGYSPAGALTSQRYDPPAMPAGGGAGVGGGGGGPLATGPGAFGAIQRDFAYDSASRLSTIVDSLRGTTHLRHDAYGRLVAVAHEGEPAEIYAYDPVGNRTHDAVLSPSVPLTRVFAAPVTPATPMASLHMAEREITGQHVRDRGNRVVRVDGRGRTLDYSFDAAGFVVAKTVILADGATSRWQFGWNSHGRLVSLTRPDGKVWRYEYDAAGRRLRKRGPDGEEIRYVWNGASILYILRNGVREATWVHDPGTGKPLLWHDDKPHYIVADAQGNPFEVVGAEGAVEWMRSGQPWGDGSLPPEAPAEPFVGQWHDAESGLNYNVYRYYDPDLGRYISPDPIGIRGGLNEYVGVTSPFIELDPLGLASPRDPGPFKLAPQGANPRTDPPTEPTAFPSAQGRSYRVGTPDQPRGPESIPLSRATAAESHTSEGPFLVAFNGDNGGSNSTVNGAHHADQVLMNHLVANSGDIPGQGPILILIRGRDVCPNCASAIDGPNGLGQQLADATGRRVIVHEDDTPAQEPRVFTPEQGC